MKARSTRWLRTLVLTLVPTSLVAAAFVLVPGTAAYAAVPSITTMGGPVNILPSAARSAAGGYSTMEYLAAYFYKASKSPEFWVEYEKAQRAAAATGKPLALEPAVAAEAKTIYPAAQKAAPLVKTVGKAAGTAGAVLTAYDVGASVTNGTLDLVGLDATGTVCNGTGRDLWGTVVQTAAGANCSAYDQKLADTFVPNADATGGVSSLTVCDPSGTNGCLRLGGSAQNPVYSDGTDYCVYVSGGNGWEDQGGGVQRLFFLYDLVRQGLYGTSTTAYPAGKYPGATSCPQPAAGSRLLTVSAYNGDKLARLGFSTDKLVSVTEGEANPTRTLKCVIAGTDGRQYTGVSDSFLESGGVLPKVNCPDLPMGVMADNTDIVETGGDKDDTIWSAKTDENVKKALTEYGECGTTSVCPLVLSKDGESCFKGADCAGWYKEADKTPYKCTYGKYPVALSECTIYANRWEPEAIRTGDNLSDPATGKPLPNPKPQLDPNSAAGVGSSPADADLGSYNCWPSGWGAFNPANWVLQPIKCAFVPREGYPKVLQKSSTKGWDQTSPAKWSAAMGAWNLTTPADGCSGIPVSMHYGVLDFDANILAACKGDVLAPFAGWSRLFVAFSLSTVGVFALIRWGGALFGFEGLGRKEDD